MNRKMLLSMFAGLLLAVGAGAVWGEEAKCKSIDKDKDCQGIRTYPVVTINTVTKKMSPEFVCAARGSVIEFRVVPPGHPKSDSVDVKAKDESNDWLVGGNSPSKMKIEVRVPLWVEEDTTHSYNIYFKDGTCIDPRVHVED